MFKNKFKLCFVAGALVLGGMISPPIQADTVTQNHSIILFQYNSFPNLADIVDNVSSSVVVIEILTKPSGNNSERSGGTGSGFILSSDGFIITNAHVVKDAFEINVVLQDKRELTGTLVGFDTLTDVAIIKINATDLNPVKIGDSSKIRAGDWVIAIGAPLGLDNTVTAGIISNKTRDTGDQIIFIQTDVAINPGNSGGPLFNLKGEVIGINSMILTKGGRFEGISLTIPINEAMLIGSELKLFGKINRGRFGIAIDQISKELAKKIGLPNTLGAVVVSVEPNGPAFIGGLKEGDIITKVEGKSVKDSSDVMRILGNLRPGNTVTITVVRSGEKQVIYITVGEIEKTPK